MDFSSLTFAPLPVSAALPRNLPPYSCSRTFALRYQIVSSPPRQELPCSRVAIHRSLCARRFQTPRAAPPPHPSCNKHTTVLVRPASVVAGPVHCSSPPVHPETAANPPLKTASRSSQSGSIRNRQDSWLHLRAR